MKDRALQFWNGPSPTKAWDRIVIAAYTLKDAVQLYIEAGGGERGATSQLRDYFGKAGGNDFHRLVPNPSRGCYLLDRRATALSFIAPKARSIIEPASEEAQQLAAQQPVPDDYGKLHVGFERGVKIDQWKFSSPHADRALADEMSCQVRMERVRREGEEELAQRRWASGIEFVATSKCWDKPLRSPDIERLFEMAQDAFRTYEIAQRGVVWEDWLEITVHDKRVYDADVAAGLSVGYKRLKRGVDQRNGRVMTITNNRVVTDFPKARAAGKKTERDDDDWHMGDDHQVAYLPATPENIAALDAIMGAVNLARVRLEGLLNQRDISKTLASIPTVPLLEAKS